MTDDLSRLAAQLDAAVAKGRRLEAMLAKVLVRDAVTDSIRRHGGRVVKLLTAHVANAVQARDLEEAKPRFVVVDPETGKDRSGVSVDDLVCEFRRSPDFAGLFGSPEAKDARLGRPLANNPWLVGPSFIATEPARLLRTNAKLAARLSQEAERARRMEVLSNFDSSYKG